MIRFGCNHSDLDRFDLDSDWIYADINFVNVDEGPLTYNGWDSPWVPTTDVDKSGVHYIDAILADQPVRWNSDPHYTDEFSEDGSTVLTFSFPGSSNEISRFTDDYDDWMTDDDDDKPSQDLDR